MSLNYNVQPKTHCSYLLSPDESKALLPDTRYAWYIYTDGSGHLDHNGGWAAVAVSKQLDKRITSYGCCTHTETGRAEFMAILSGLHSILDAVQEYGKLSALAARRPRVLIVSDRQDLVGCVNKEYTRKAHGDLWAQYDWYCGFFEISAVHVPRETNPVQHIADVHASSMRVVLVDYATLQNETVNV